MATRDNRATRAAAVADAVDRDGLDVIRFVKARTGVVHVLTVPDYLPKRHAELFGDGPGERQMRFMLGEVWAVCGVRIVRHRGGFETGGRIVSHFPDDELCQPCHAAFGDRAVLIFEANQDDGEDPTQLGRLVDDTVTKNAAALQ